MVQKLPHKKRRRVVWKCENVWQFLDGDGRPTSNSDVIQPEQSNKMVTELWTLKFATKFENNNSVFFSVLHVHLGSINSIKAEFLDVLF